MDNILEKYQYFKAIQITSWLKRLNSTRRKKAERIKGPLTIVEVELSTGIWIQKAQAEFESTDKFTELQQLLSLVRDDRGLYICKGRIRGEYQIFLLSDSLFSERVVMYAHLSTHCGGTGLTMAKIRESYWIPRLRRLTKRVIKCCFACKRFHTKPFTTPKPGLLPKDRTEGKRPFEIEGADYAGPIIYRAKKNMDGKACILLISCSLTRAVYIELLPDATTRTLIPAFKRFVARRGRPAKDYSDNAQTFKSSSKWIKQVVMDERFHEFLSNQSIVWHFNLNKAPWWGGQYE